MEAILPMSHERVSSLTSSTPSDSRTISQATVSYPAKRVDSSARVAAASSSSTNLNDETPNSQESHVSSSSKGSVLARLTSNSSNVSNVSPDTESTSPLSLHGPFSHRLQEAQFQSAQRPLTPDTGNGLNVGGSEGTESVSVSPSSVDSAHLKHGSKRTASGAVKPQLPALATGPVYAPQKHSSDLYGRDRNPKRITEISAQLKTRLSYAMVKVQNGWENQSLNELEMLPSQISAPSTPITQSPSSRRPGTGTRRHSIYSEASDHYLNSPGSQTSPPMFQGMFPPQPSHRNGVSQWQPAPTRPNGPSLAPAAPISSSRPSRRSMSSRAPPNLMTSGHHGSTTSTPARQGILRMPSQQAEKDALETLLFMSSPNHSTNAKYSTADPSPLRSEFPAAAKRVVFEGQ